MTEYSVRTIINAAREMLSVVPFLIIIIVMFEVGRAIVVDVMYDRDKCIERGCRWYVQNSSGTSYCDYDMCAPKGVINK